MTLERIQSKCIEDGDCWIWQGQFISHAPRIWKGDKYVSVRQEVVTFLGKLRPEAEYFGTTCRNPMCVCPDHIAQRTKAEQLQMRARLGSTGTSLQMRSRRAAETMRAKVGKVTQEQAREIRVADRTLKDLSEEYGIAMETVRRIRAGMTRKDNSNPFAGLMA